MSPSRTFILRPIATSLMMVGVLLPRADPQSEDAADALAVAVTHAHHRLSVLTTMAAR